MSVLPKVTFQDFVKNPFVAILFMCLMAIGYLYYDNKKVLTNQIERLETEVDSLKKDCKSLNAKLFDVVGKIKQ